MSEVWEHIRSLVGWFWSPEPVNTVQEFFGPAWEPFFGAVTLLASAYAIAVVTSSALWFAGRRLAYLLLGAVAFESATNALLWTLFGVHRPDAPEIIVRSHVGVSSFPSGHTVAAVVVWGYLAMSSRVPKVVPFLVVPLVMISRLYLGAHYLGDVLASVLIGVVLLIVYLYLGPMILGWLERLPFWLFLILGLCAPFGILLFLGPSSRGLAFFSVALAAGIGLPLEYRYVRYKPTEAGFRRQLLKAVVGFAGMGALLLTYALLRAAYPVLAYALLASAVLWGVLLAPALFGSEGLSTRRDGGRGA